MFKRLLSLTVIVCFFLTSLGPIPKAHADTVLDLPQPGTMINLSPAYEPALIKGLTVHKDNPFLFDFIVDTGNDSSLSFPNASAGNLKLKQEADRLIKYFFACLTIPEKDLWVNLSPYEKDRMIPNALGQTALGRDLLAQDYILKQLTASLIYPEKNLGKEFWNRVYAKAQQMYGTTQIPVNTFNKVWILADKATVYEHGQTAFVVNGHLKVMLEEDYLALQKHQGQPGNSSVSQNCFPAGCQANEGSSLKASQGNNLTHNVASSIIRQIILPELEKEVNTGKNFAMLRQIFYSQILATWYKKNLKEALLNQVYADKSTVKGVNLNDPSVKEQIYQQYLKAYKKGVFNYIKEESVMSSPNVLVGDPGHATVARKYFSGGYHAELEKGLIVANDSNAMVAPQELRNATEPIGSMAMMTVLDDINGGVPTRARKPNESFSYSVAGWATSLSSISAAPAVLYEYGNTKVKIHRKYEDPYLRINNEAVPINIDDYFAAWQDLILVTQKYTPNQPVRAFKIFNGAVVEIKPEIVKKFISGGQYGPTSVGHTSAILDFGAYQPEEFRKLHREKISWAINFAGPDGRLRIGAEGMRVDLEGLHNAAMTIPASPAIKQVAAKLRNQILTIPPDFKMNQAQLSDLAMTTVEAIDLILQEPQFVAATPGTDIGKLKNQLVELKKLLGAFNQNLIWASRNNKFTGLELMAAAILCYLLCNYLPVFESSPDSVKLIIFFAYVFLPITALLSPAYFVGSYILLDNYNLQKSTILKAASLLNHDVIMLKEIDPDLRDKIQKLMAALPMAIEGNALQPTDAAMGAATTDPQELARMEGILHESIDSRIVNLVMGYIKGERRPDFYLASIIDVTNGQINKQVGQWILDAAWLTAHFGLSKEEFIELKGNLLSIPIPLGSKRLTSDSFSVDELSTRMWQGWKATTNFYKLTPATDNPADIQRVEKLYDGSGYSDQVVKLIMSFVKGENDPKYLASRIAEESNGKIDRNNAEKLLKIAYVMAQDPSLMRRDFDVLRLLGDGEINAIGHPAFEEFEKLDKEYTWADAAMNTFIDLASGRVFVEEINPQGVVKLLRGNDLKSLNPKDVGLKRLRGLFSTDFSGVDYRHFDEMNFELLDTVIQRMIKQNNNEPMFREMVESKNGQNKYYSYLGIVIRFLMSKDSKLKDRMFSEKKFLSSGNSSLAWRALLKAILIFAGITEETINPAMTTIQLPFIQAGILQSSTLKPFSAKLSDGQDVSIQIIPESGSNWTGFPKNKGRYRLFVNAKPIGEINAQDYIGIQGDFLFILHKNYPDMPFMKIFNIKEKVFLNENDMEVITPEDRLDFVTEKRFESLKKYKGFFYPILMELLESNGDVYEKGGHYFVHRDFIRVNNDVTKVYPDQSREIEGILKQIKLSEPYFDNEGNIFWQIGQQPHQARIKTKQASEVTAPTSSAMTVSSSKAMLSFLHTQEVPNIDTGKLGALFGIVVVLSLIWNNWAKKNLPTKADADDLLKQVRLGVGVADENYRLFVPLVEKGERHYQAKMRLLDQMVDGLHLQLTQNLTGFLTGAIYHKGILSEMESWLKAWKEGPADVEIATPAMLTFSGAVHNTYGDVLNAKVIKILAGIAPLSEDLDRLREIRDQRYVERQTLGEKIDFLPESNSDGSDAFIPGTNIKVKDARAGNFEGAPIPQDLQRQWIQLTGPAAKSPQDKTNAKDPEQSLRLDLRNVAHALLSGADGMMFDGEDALGQLDTMSLDNVRALAEAYKKTPLFWQVVEEVAREDIADGKRPADWDWKKLIDENFTTRIYRVRGMHLDDRHIKFGDSHGMQTPVSATIVDMVTYLVNAGPELIKQGSTPTLYLPKLQTAEEAAWMAGVIDKIENAMGWQRGTVKVFVLIEQLEEAFQLMEIRAALGKHFVGFNTGRWDYIADVVKQNMWDNTWVPPNFKEMTMVYPFMHNYEGRVVRAVNTPDKNGNTVLWIGGMEPQIPVVKGTISAPDKEKVIEGAMQIAEKSKLRELQRGASGTWVAHPKMVERLRRVYQKNLFGVTGKVNQLGITENLSGEKLGKLDYTPEAAVKLTELKPGARTVAEARFLVSVALQYVNAYLTGRAAAALKGADLFGDPLTLFIMEDMATGEGRTKLAMKWMRARAEITEVTDDDRRTLGIDTGARFSKELLQKIVDQEYEKLQKAPENIVYVSSKEKELPIAKMIVNKFLFSNTTVPLPWLIDLANMGLNAKNLGDAMAKVNSYIEAYRNSSGLVRLTANPQFSDFAMNTEPTIEDVSGMYRLAFYGEARADDGRLMVPLVQKREAHYEALLALMQEMVAALGLTMTGDTQENPSVRGVLYAKGILEKIKEWLPKKKEKLSNAAMTSERLREIVREVDEFERKTNLKIESGFDFEFIWSPVDSDSMRFFSEGSRQNEKQEITHYAYIIGPQVTGDIFIRTITGVIEKRKKGLLSTAPWTTFKQEVERILNKPDTAMTTRIASSSLVSYDNLREAIEQKNEAMSVINWLPVLTIVGFGVGLSWWVVNQGKRYTFKNLRNNTVKVTYLKGKTLLNTFPAKFGVKRFEQKGTLDQFKYASGVSVWIEYDQHTKNPVEARIYPNNTIPGLRANNPEEKDPEDNDYAMAGKALDHVVFAPHAPGGIDLNSANMGMTVTKDANGGVKVNFDPAMIARIRAEGVQSAVPVIINVTPMSQAQIRPLLGLKEPEENEKLASLS